MILFEAILEHGWYQSQMEVSETFRNYVTILKKEYGVRERGDHLVFKDLGEICLSFNHANDTIKLETIYVDSYKRGNGAGTKMMTMIIRAADEAQVSLSLHPMPFESERYDSPGREVLRNWYKRFGFEGEAGEMIRNAQ